MSEIDRRGYYRNPSVVVEKNSDIAFAFTMRMLNFLGTLEVWTKDLSIQPYGVEKYAERMTDRFGVFPPR